MKHIDLVPLGWEVSHYDVVFTPSLSIVHTDCSVLVEVPYLSFLSLARAKSLVESVNTQTLRNLDSTTRLGDRLVQTISRWLYRKGGSSFAVVGARLLLAEFGHAWCYRTSSPLSGDFLRFLVDDFPIRLVFETPGSWKPTRLEKLPMK